MKSPARRRPVATWCGHGALVPSLVLVVPLLLAYDIGLLFARAANGADVLSGAIFALCGRSAPLYLLIHAGAALGFLWWARRSGHHASLRAEVVAPLVLEAAIYALTLGTAIGLLVHDGLGLGVRLGHTGTGIVTSLGAGVHEELVFRLGAFLGGAALLRRAGVRPLLALGLALLASSLLFAAAHHVGAHGEPWRAGAFVFRALAGVAFALICWHRSLAHAVYAHVLYDLTVVLLR